MILKYFLTHIKGAVLKNAFIFFNICLLFLFFQSCSQTYYVSYLQHNTECINCGKSDDGILEFQLKNEWRDTKFITIGIRNISDETVLIYLKHITLTKDDNLIYSPAGWANPYVSQSYTTTSINQFSSGRLYGEAHSSINSYYSLFSNLSSKLSSASYSTANSITTNYSEYDIVTLPPRTIFYYNVKNIVNDIFEYYDYYVAVYGFQKRKIKIDYWESTLRKTFDNSTIKINVVYKLLNDNNLRSTAMHYKPYEIKIDFYEKKM